MLKEIPVRNINQITRRNGKAYFKKRYAFFITLTGLFCGLLLSLNLAWAEQEPNWDKFTNIQIVNAIFKAEGGYKAKYLYGIRSIKYRNEVDARQICLNSIRNGRKRWLKADKSDDLIVFIGKRYCPPKTHKLNSNWVKNVKYWLIQNV